MKPYQSLCLSAILGLALLATPAPAVTIEDVPNPRNAGSWISDNADLLSASSEAQLNQLLTELEADSGTEMTIVTVSETSPAASPKAFTTDLFNYWGVGKADEDNGVVFMISEGDRRAEVVVGYGLESVLTQSKIEGLLEREAIPDFKQGNYDRGIVDASKTIVSELSPTRALPDNGNTTDPYSAIGTEQTSPTMTSRGQGPLRMMLAAGGGILAIIGVVLGKRKKTCDRCHTPLVELDAATTQPHLYKAQKVAARLGSVTYTGWQCPSCSQIEIKRSRYLLTAYTNCPRCQEPTVLSTREPIQRATRYSSGTEKVTNVCQCCDYKNTKTVSLAPLHNPSHSSGYGGSSGSSGGGSFGGGSSGGSGGGSSW